MSLSLKIENFKRFATFELPLDKEALVIYGPNGSGKTQLLWALVLGLRAHNLKYNKSTHKHTAEFALNSEIGYLLNNSGLNLLPSYSSLIHDLKGKDQGEATFSFESNQDVIFKVSLFANGTVKFTKLQEVSYNERKILYAFMAPEFLFGNPRFEILGDVDVLTCGYQNLRLKYSKLLDNQKTFILTHMRDLFEVQAIDQETDKIPILITEKNGTQLEVMFQGAAFQKVFASFVLLYSLQNIKEGIEKYYLIEEVESLLYPALIQKYLDILKDVCKNNDTHLILTSNSSIVIDQIQDRIPLSLAVGGTVQDENSVRDLVFGDLDEKPILICDGSDDIYFIKEFTSFSSQCILFSRESVLEPKKEKFIVDIIKQRTKNRCRKVIFLKDPEFLPESLIKAYQEKEKAAYGDSVEVIFLDLPCIESFFILDCLLKLNSDKERKEKVNQYFEKNKNSLDLFLTGYLQSVAKAQKFDLTAPPDSYLLYQRAQEELKKTTDINWKLIVQVIHGHAWCKTVWDFKATVRYFESLLPKFQFHKDVPVQDLFDQIEAALNNRS